MAKATKKKAATPDAPIWMTGEAFARNIIKLGFNQQSFARQISVNDRTVRAWISGKNIVPRIVAQLVNLMIDTEATAEHLKP